MNPVKAEQKLIELLLQSRAGGVQIITGSAGVQIFWHENGQAERFAEVLVRLKEWCNEQ